MMLYASPSPFSSSASCATLRSLSPPATTSQQTWPSPINIPSAEEVHMLIAQHYRELCQRKSSKLAAMEAGESVVVDAGGSGGHHDDAADVGRAEAVEAARAGAGSSPIAQLKKLHGWITGELIKESSSTLGGGRRRELQQQLAVLDMACGKGGEMGKWKEAGVVVGMYVGADVVGASLEHAKRRYAAEGCAFPARLLCADCFSPAFPEAAAAAADTGVGGGAVGFDVCSCQFAFHYAWSSARRARQALLNVSSLLKPGGLFIGTLPDSSRILHKLLESSHQPAGSAYNYNNDNTGQFVFGNSLFRVSFDPRSFSRALALSRGLLPFDHSFGIQYEFHLEDAVYHCPEWLVPFDALVSLAHDCGLRLLSKSNFHDFVREQLFLHNNIKYTQALPPPPSSSSCPNTLANHNERSPELADLLHNICPEEWECASIYTTFVFQKCP